MIPTLSLNSVKILDNGNSNIDCKDIIYGTGVDILEITRIQTLLSKYKTTFIGKILNSDEQSLFDSVGPARQAAYLAKRFACKEAISKALGVGIGHECSFHDISIINCPRGKPIANLSINAVNRIFNNTPDNRYIHPNDIMIHISMSDEKKYAVAHAIIAIKMR